MVTPKTNNSYDSDNRISGFNYYNDNSVNLDSYSFTYYDSNNIIEKVVNGRVNTYSWDELNQLIRADNQGEFEIDPTKLDVTQKLGTVQEDYVGQKPLDFNVDDTELKLDYNSISIGFDIGMDTKLNRLVINPESISDRLREDKFAIYTSDDNQSWQIMSRDLWSFNPEDLSVEISFKEPVSSRYIKLHCFYDDRSEMGVATDLSQIRNSRDSLLTAFVTVDRMIEEFSYDSAGNRHEYNVNYTNNRGYVSSYSYYENSNLIKSDNKFGYIWDNNGNLVEKSDDFTVTGNEVTLNPASGNYTKYTYDLLNRLVKVGLSTSGSNNVTKEINYTYDHRGYRLKRVGSKVDDVTYYSFGLSGEILYKENPSKDRYEEYIYLFGQHYAKEVGKLSLPNEKTRMYYHTDHLGSTIAITDVNGDKIWSNNYTSFGKSTNESGLIEELGIYTSKEIDPETGLYYFNARWYDPEMGRFITEDPIKDGNNWYIYCNNNPLTYIDPTGLFARPNPNVPRNDSGVQVNVTGENHGFNTINAQNGPWNSMGSPGVGDFTTSLTSSAMIDYTSPLEMAYNEYQDSKSKNPFKKISRWYKQRKADKRQERMFQFHSDFFRATYGLTVNEAITEYNERTYESLNAENLRILFSDNIREMAIAEKMLKQNLNLHTELRDILNVNVPQTLAEAEALAAAGVWIKLSDMKSKFHDPDSHFKFVSADGLREAVYDKVKGVLIVRDTTILSGKFKGQKGELIMGTFNFSAPDTKGTFGHYVKDVEPYWHWGRN